MSTYSDKSWNSADEDLATYGHDDVLRGRSRQSEDGHEGRGSRSSSSSSNKHHHPSGRRTSSSGEIDLIPGGVVTTQNISTVIKPNPKQDPLQFVKISSTELSKKAVEQIRLAEEVKITKEKIKESDEDWQNNLLSWKSKRRQSRSKLTSDLEEEANSDQGSNRKIKTFSEILAEKKKSGHRIGYNLLGEDESVDQELEQILAGRNNQGGAHNFDEDDNQRRCPDGQETTSQSDTNRDGVHQKCDQREGDIVLKSTQHFDKQDRDSKQDNELDRRHGDNNEHGSRGKSQNKTDSSHYRSENRAANGDHNDSYLSHSKENRPEDSYDDSYDHRRPEDQGDEGEAEEEKDKRRRQGLNEIQQNVLEYLERQQQHSSNGRDYTRPSANPTQGPTEHTLIADEEDDDLLGHDDSYDYEEWQRQQEEQLISFRQKLSAFENLAKSKGEESKETTTTKPKTSSSTSVGNGSRQEKSSSRSLTTSTSSPSKNVILTSNNKTQVTAGGGYQMAPSTSLPTNKTSSLYITQNPSVSTSSSAPYGAKVRPQYATSGSGYNSNAADYQRHYSSSAAPAHPQYAANQQSTKPQYNQPLHDQSYPQSLQQYNAINNQPLYENLVRGPDNRAAPGQIDETASKLNKVQLAPDSRYNGAPVNVTYTGNNSKIAYRQGPIPNQVPPGQNFHSQPQAPVNDYYANLPADSRYPPQPAAQYYQSKSSQIPQQMAKSQPKMSAPAQRPMPQYGPEAHRMPPTNVPNPAPGSNAAQQQTGYNRNHWLLHEAELRRQMANNQAPSQGQPPSGKIPTSGSQVANQIVPNSLQKPQPLYSNQPFIGNGSGYPGAVNPTSAPVDQQKRGVLSVSGRKKCSNCGDELGRGCAAMVIESLHLYYHINCFRCSVCHIQLGNGTCGTDVRVRNQKLHCHNCYSNDEAGLKFSRV